MTPDEGRAFLVERLRAVADGDRQALRAVYERTAAKLFGVCLRILDNREEAEDVLQDVYLTVWNRADSFDPARASPITWLATIARNRAIDRRRQLGPRIFDRPVDGAVDVADETPDALALLHRSDDARRLAECLDGLDGRTRVMIVTAFYGGDTYNELAETAGVPLGTMKSLIRRGLMRLKECLSS
nr:sigma-70 family RNA polymerase sigma factor [Aurantimonas endophytica]